MNLKHLSEHSVKLQLAKYGIGLELEEAIRSPGPRFFNTTDSANYWNTLLILTCVLLHEPHYEKVRDIYRLSRTQSEAEITKHIADLFNGSNINFADLPVSVHTLYAERALKGLEYDDLEDMAKMTLKHVISATRDSQNYHAAVGALHALEVSELDAPFTLR